MKNYLIIGLLIIIAILIFIKNKPVEIVKWRVKSDTVIMVKDTTIWKDKLIYKKDTVRLPGKIDTQWVIGDYYTAKFYEDSVTGIDWSVKIKDTIKENSIIGRSYNVNVKHKIIKDSIFIEKQKFKPSLYIGPNYNLNSNTVGFGMNLNLNLININAGWNRGFIIGAGYKIK